VGCPGVPVAPIKVPVKDPCLSLLSQGSLQRSCLYALVTPHSCCPGGSTSSHGMLGAELQLTRPYCRYVTAAPRQLWNWDDQFKEV